MLELRDILNVARRLNEGKKQIISKAYHFALQTHKDKLRLFSKERIDEHITRLGFVLAELGMSDEVIAAGLLHHTLREGAISRERLVAEFGKTITLLVEGATRLRDIKYTSDVGHIESLRKLFVASATDIRILILKLADRLDSERSFSNLEPERRYHMARETMEIYVPLARRLGFQKMSREMEDLSFQYIEPERYRELQKWLKKRQHERAHPLEKFHKSLLKHFAKAGMRNVETDTRQKGIYSIHEKIYFHKKELEDVHDVLAISVQVDTVEDCYRALGVVHAKWRPLPGKIKDYIAFPKTNGYQSLHTTVFIGDGDIIEIQIRTREMHERAEYGIASHFSYKERKKNTSDPYYSWLNQFLSFDKADEKEKSYSYVPKWLRHIIHGGSKDVSETDHITNLKSDFFQNRMFIFDPRGEVLDLPVHATPVDFAYELDAERAHHLHGAKVNGKMVPISTELRSGDIVEIVTRDSAHPTEKWHTYAKTVLAKKMIRQYLDSTADSSRRGKADTQHI